MGKILYYADHGVSRASVRLPEDPSLMIYGIFHAIGQDLRQSALYLHLLTEKAYHKAILEPSRSRKMGQFYGLLSRLVIIKLNTAALKNISINLQDFIDAMHDEKSTNIPLISKNTQRVYLDRSRAHKLIANRYMIKYEMELADFLAEEVADWIRKAEVISNLAFNILTASSNNFLKVIAAVTLLLVPMTLVISLLSSKLAVK